MTLPRFPARVLFHPSLLILAAGALLLPAARAASDPASVTTHLLIQEHRFLPVELHVPAHQPLLLQVENRDDTVEEFESYDLDREQRVRPGEVGTVRLAPLAPGRYPFFGDFHRKTAQGVLVVD